MKNTKDISIVIPLFNEEKSIKELYRKLKNYHLIFRIIPMTPQPVINFILKCRLYKLFRFMPQTMVLIIVDVMVSFLKRDHYAIMAMKSYLWEIKRRVSNRLKILPVKERRLC